METGNMDLTKLEAPVAAAPQPRLLLMMLLPLIACSVPPLPFNRALLLSTQSPHPWVEPAPHDCLAPRPPPRLTETGSTGIPAEHSACPADFII